MLESVIQKTGQLTGLRAQREVAREDTEHLIANVPTSVRRTYELTQIPRSTFRFRRDPTRDESLGTRLMELPQEKPRFGYCRLLVLIRWDGTLVIHKRLLRIYRAAGRSGKRERRKRLVRACLPRMRPTAPNEEWSLDFVHDQLVSGRAVRVLDTFTRECLALEVGTSYASRRVTRVLDGIIAERGRRRPPPSAHGQRERTDLAPFLKRGRGGETGVGYIQPGKPVQNAYVENFNGNLRDECLNVSRFPNCASRKSGSDW